MDHAAQINERFANYRSYFLFEWLRCAYSIDRESPTWGGERRLKLIKPPRVPPGHHLVMARSTRPALPEPQQALFQATEPIRNLLRLPSLGALLLGYHQPLT